MSVDSSVPLEEQVREQIREAIARGETAWRSTTVSPGCDVSSRNAEHPPLMTERSP